MRILIISFYFPPYNTIGAVRVGKLAKYLARHGNEVRVVTARDPSWVGKIEETLPTEISPDWVLRTPWIQPPASIVSRRQTRQVSGIQGKNGWRSWLATTLTPSPYGTAGWIPSAAQTIHKLSRTWRPDVILASALPPTALLLGAWASKRLGVPWVADLRDPWADNHYHRHSRMRQQLEQRIERSVLTTAASIVTVTKPWVEMYKEKYELPVFHIPNGYDPEDYKGLRAKRLVAEESLSIVYLGTLYGGRRDPAPLLDAVRLIESKTSIRLFFFGPDSNLVSQSNNLKSIEHLVEMKEPVPYSDSLSIQLGADVLLILVWDTPSERGMIPAKVFEYMGAGKRILCVAPQGSEVSRLVKEYDLGLVSRNPEEIANWLVALDKSSSPVESSQGKNLKQHTREQQAIEMREVLQDAANR